MVVLKMDLFDFLKYNLAILCVFCLFGFIIFYEILAFSKIGVDWRSRYIQETLFVYHLDLFIFVR